MHAACPVLTMSLTVSLTASRSPLATSSCEARRACSPRRACASLPRARSLACSLFRACARARVLPPKSCGEANGRSAVRRTRSRTVSLRPVSSGSVACSRCRFDVMTGRFHVFLPHCRPVTLATAVVSELRSGRGGLILNPQLPVRGTAPTTGVSSDASPPLAPQLVDPPNDRLEILLEASPPPERGQPLPLHAGPLVEALLIELVLDLVARHFHLQRPERLGQVHAAAGVDRHRLAQLRTESEGGRTDIGSEGRRQRRVVHAQGAGEVDAGARVHCFRGGGARHDGDEVVDRAARVWVRDGLAVRVELLDVGECPSWIAGGGDCEARAGRGGRRLFPRRLGPVLRSRESFQWGKEWIVGVRTLADGVCGWGCVCAGVCSSSASSALLAAACAGAVFDAEVVIVRYRHCREFVGRWMRVAREHSGRQEDVEGFTEASIAVLAGLVMLAIFGRKRFSTINPRIASLCGQGCRRSTDADRVKAYRRLEDFTGYGARVQQCRPQKSMMDIAEIRRAAVFPHATPAPGL
ncbi:hypothetical protein MRB53_039434 [Persea americana]|nr:hypothetical protein MRB53_039434 [Persea americana]